MHGFLQPATGYFCPNFGSGLAAILAVQASFCCYFLGSTAVSRSLIEDKSDAMPETLTRYTEARVTWNSFDRIASPSMQDPCARYPGAETHGHFYQRALVGGIEGCRRSGCQFFAWFKLASAEWLALGISEARHATTALAQEDSLGLTPR